MYVFTENAFLNIVAHEHDERLLEVRAKGAGELERTFPEAEIAHHPGQDYAFSASIPRDRVAERIALRIKHVGYRKFNPVSDEPWRQTVCANVEAALDLGQKLREAGEGR